MRKSDVESFNHYIEDDWVYLGSTKSKEENIKVKLIGFKKAYGLVETGEEEKHVFVEHKLNN